MSVHQKIVQLLLLNDITSCSIWSTQTATCTQSGNFRKIWKQGEKMPATGTACVKTQELTAFTEWGKISCEKRLPDFCGCCLIRLLVARMWKHQLHSGEGGRAQTVSVCCVLSLSRHHLLHHNMCIHSTLKTLRLENWDVGVWTGSSWLRIGTGGGHL